MASSWTISWSSAILKMINSFQLDEIEIHAVNEADKLKILPHILEKIFVSINIDVPTNATTQDLKNIFIKEYFLLNDENPSLNFNDEEDNLIFLTVLMFISFCKYECLQLNEILKMELVDDHSARALVHFFQTLIDLDIERFTKNDVIQFVKKSMYVEKASHQHSSPATPNGPNTHRQESSESPSLKIWREKLLDKQVKDYKCRLQEKEEEEEKSNKTINTLEKENAELRMKLNEKVKENIKLKEDLDFKFNMSCSNEETANELAALRGTVRDLTAELQFNKTEIDRLCTERDSLHVKNSGLMKEMEKFQNNLEEIIKQKEDCEAIIIKIKKENENLQMANKDLKQEVEQLQEDKSEVANPLDYSTPLESETCAVVIEKQLDEKQEIINSLQTEKATLEATRLREVKQVQTLENQIKSIKAKIREEFEEKLARLKIKMKDTCTRAVEKTQEDCDKKLKKHQEVIKDGQDHITQLSSQLWDTSDKLITTKKENETLRRSVLELENALLKHKAYLFQNIIELNALKRRTKSYESLSPRTSSMRLEDSLDITRRSSFRTIPSGMGKVFPSEDEGEEMFSNDMLADLKAGRCQVGSSGDPDRLSTLMYRNSMCPPHLKSSYPAETQFLPITACHDDDIKGRGAESEDAKSLCSEKAPRKGRTQVSKTTNMTPRNALKDLNDSRKPGTPSRLFQFFGSSRRDENTPTNSRRLSFFNRRVKKEPKE